MANDAHVLVPPPEASQASEQAPLDEDEEMRILATKHLQSLKQMNNQKAEQGMVKSASTEILCQYNQQPIHVRSRAEQVRL